MNHFLLPGEDRDERGGDARRFEGAYAMEVLVNDLLKRGAGASVCRRSCSAARA